MPNAGGSAAPAQAAPVQAQAAPAQAAPAQSGGLAASYDAAVRPKMQAVKDSAAALKIAQVILGTD